MENNTKISGFNDVLVVQADNIGNICNELLNGDARIDYVSSDSSIDLVNLTINTHIQVGVRYNGDHT